MGEDNVIEFGAPKTARDVPTANDVAEHPAVPEARPASINPADMTQQKAAPVRTDPMPTPARRRPFDPSSKQHALDDRPDDEGGVSNMTTGGASFMRDTIEQSSMYYPEKERTGKALQDSYELAGFVVQYEPSHDSGPVSVHVRNYFPDLELAMASVTNGKYLMPGMNRVVVGRILSGSPTISRDEHVMYQYVDGQWRRM